MGSKDNRFCLDGAARFFFAIASKSLAKILPEVLFSCINVAFLDTV